LKRRHVPLVGYGLFDSAEYASHPAFANPSTPALERVGRMIANGLLAQSWANKRWPTGKCPTETKPKIGYITYDITGYHAAYDREVKPIFQRAGQPIAQTVFTPYDQNGPPGAFNGPFATSMQNAVLQFSSNCIDHVMFLTNAG